MPAKRKSKTKKPVAKPKAWQTASAEAAASVAGAFKLEPFVMPVTESFPPALWATFNPHSMSHFWSLVSSDWFESTGLLRDLIALIGAYVLVSGKPNPPTHHPLISADAAAFCCY